MIKSVAQYHKLHKILPIMAGKESRKTDLGKLPKRLTMTENDRLVRFRGKVKIKDQ